MKTCWLTASRNGIAFIPFWPLHSGALTKSQSVKDIATRVDATPAQVALAWLLKKSPAVILIPGTSAISHLKENAAACDIALSRADMEKATTSDSGRYFVSTARLSAAQVFFCSRSKPTSEDRKRSESAGHCCHPEEHR